MKAQRCDTTEFESNKRCPNPAKWTVVQWGGQRRFLCGVHARSWKKWQPENVKRLQVSESDEP